jgi:hypothetical protein
MKKFDLIYLKFLVMKLCYNSLYKLETIDKHVSKFILDYKIVKNNVNATIKTHIINSIDKLIQVEFTLDNIKYNIRIKKSYFDEKYLVNLTIQEDKKLNVFCTYSDLVQLYDKLVDYID